MTIDPIDLQLDLEIEKMQIESMRRDNQIPVSRYAEYLIKWRDEQRRIRLMFEAQLRKVK